MENDSSRMMDLLTRADSERAAIIRDDSVVSFAELRDSARKVAAALHAQGIRRFDRIAVMLPNGVEWLAAMFGAAELGAAVVSLNIRLSAKEVGDLVSRADVRAIIYDSDVLGGGCAKTLCAIDPALMESVACFFRSGGPTASDKPGSVPEIDLAAVLAAALPEEVPATGRHEDPWLMLATSGTTGRSKIVVHLQGRVAAHFTHIAERSGLTEPATKTLAVMPFCGGYGLTLLMSAMAGGQTTVIADGFDPVATGDLIRRHGVTHMGGTNDMLLNMLRADPRPDPFPTLRFYGHANFTPSLIEMPPEAERRNVAIRGGYGLTEMLALVAMQPMNADLERRAEAGGLLVDKGAEFRIVDPDDRQPVTFGEVGEIEVRSPNVMLGYLNDDAATAEAFTDDGFLRTGDLGRALPDGGLTFDSRRNDVLRIGGYLVAPGEIEDVILDMPGIEACQVVAVAQAVGVRPVAFAITGQGAPDEDSVIAGCRARLAKYKVPIRIFYVNDFPSVDGPNGRKVKRNELRDLAVQMLRTEIA